MALRHPASRSWLCAAAALALAASTLGCARGTRTAAHPPAGAEPAELEAGQDDAEPLLQQDPGYVAGAQLRAELQRRLAAVERELLSSASGSAGPATSGEAESSATPSPEERLAEQRIRLTVALARVERQLARRRRELLALGPGAPRRAPADEPAGGTIDRQADRMLEDAAGRIALAREARLAQAAQTRLERELVTGRKQGVSPPKGDRNLDGRRYDFKGGAIDGDQEEPEEPEVDLPPGAYRMPVFVPELPPKEGKPEPARPRPKGRARAAVLQPSAPPPGLHAALQRQLVVMSDCIPSEQRVQGGIALRLRALFAADGSLRSPQVESATDLPPTVTSCLVDAVARVRAPAPADGTSRMIVMPLWLDLSE